MVPLSLFHNQDFQSVAEQRLFTDLQTTQVGCGAAAGVGGQEARRHGGCLVSSCHPPTQTAERWGCIA